MLREIRNDEHLFSVAKFDIKKEDVEDFNNELKGFHGNFRDCFSRSESRDHFFKYMVGQFSELERKSIKPIALAVKDGNVRAMQHFVSDVIWHEERLLIKFLSVNNAYLSEGDDRCGHMQQGHIGVCALLVADQDLSEAVEP